MTTARLMACAGLVHLVTGCADPVVIAPLPILAGEGFFDAPWPSDGRMDAEGHADLSDYPMRDEVTTLDSYLSYAETIVGFGNNSPIYFRLEGPPEGLSYEEDGVTVTDPGPMPDEAASARADSPVLLLDVDPTSPHRGQIIPVHWDFQATETAYQPSNLLSILPVPGFPLRPHTQYAALLLEPVALAGPAFQKVFDEEDPSHDAFASLQETLRDLDIEEESVAVATVFTSSNPVAEMGEYARYIRESLSLPVVDQDLTLIGSFSDYNLYEGWMYIPLFQEGQRPYASEGGKLHRTATGTPAPDSWEHIRFSVTVPQGMDMPADGWPLYIYSHGTGGDYISYAATGEGYEEANVLSPRGLAGLGIDQPLHGLRSSGGDPEFYTFNYFNPDASRNNLRQSALDNVFLASLLTERQAVFQTPADGEVRLDPQHVVFMGHSQGGIVQAMALPFVGDLLRGAVLSGAGGGIAITLIERKQDLDITKLLASVLQTAEGEVIDMFHPVVGMVQWLADVTDPINYAPFWFAEKPRWNAAPVSVLMTEGLEDTYTPPHATEALAAAALVPPTDPQRSELLALELKGVEALEPPTSGETSAWDGSAVTTGLLQYTHEGHCAIYYNGDLADRYAHFLVTAIDDEVPEIVK